MLSEEIAEKVQLLEKEKLSLLTMRLQIPVEFQEAKEKEIEQLKQRHRSDLSFCYDFEDIVFA